MSSLSPDLILKEQGPDPASSCFDEQLDAGFKAVVEAAPYGMLMVNTSGEIMMVNDRLCQTFGYSRDEMKGQLVEMLLPKRHRHAHVPLRQGFAHSPSQRSMGSGRDLTGLRKDGLEFPVEIALTSVETARGRRMIATVVDITERKRSEMELREANAQLEEFAYVASHDLRSPMRGIGSLIDFMKEDIGEDAPPHILNHLLRMQERVKRMERLIEDLLVYARAGRRSVKFETIDLAEMVDDLIKLEPVPQGMIFESDLTASMFEGAKVPLNTVLRNLYSNAIKHHDKPDGKIKISSFSQGPDVVIEVTDNGPGIPEAVQGRAFRLFQTLTSGERKGTGLGLAVSKRLVDGHGGKIVLISKDDELGTTFRIHWPRFVRTDLDN